ncbi:hypothetical protein JB92DRAFT_2836135 [Gautieria morchelliformis]|nr:hypothetical protein JB92DRAFT_2836135 [Gautieria morchelliformis]
MAKRRPSPVLVHLQSFLGRLMGCLSPKPFTESTPSFTCANEQNLDIPDNRHTSTFAVSTAETAWNAHGNEDMHLEMLTEVVDGGEFDEEIQSENLNTDMPSQITITYNLYTTHDASTQMDFSTISRGTS